MTMIVVFEQVDIRLNRVSAFRKLKTEPAEFWVKLLSAYFVGTNYVVVSIIFTFNLTRLLSPFGSDKKDNGTFFYSPASSPLDR